MPTALLRSSRARLLSAYAGLRSSKRRMFSVYAELRLVKHFRNGKDNTTDVLEFTRNGQSFLYPLTERGKMALEEVCPRFTRGLVLSRYVLVPVLAPWYQRAFVALGITHIRIAMEDV